MAEGQGPSAHVILVLRECIWNVPVVLPDFDNTVSLGSPPHQVVYPPDSMVPPWVAASRFMAENREAELKFTTFYSLVLFRVFLSFVFSLPLNDTAPFSAALWGYSFNNNNNNNNNNNAL